MQSILMFVDELKLHCIATELQKNCTTQQLEKGKGSNNGCGLKDE